MCLPTSLLPSPCAPSESKDSYPWFNVQGSDVMLTLEWLVATIGGFIQAPLDHPLLRMMRRGCEIAAKFPQVLYISMGFGQTMSSSRLPRNWQVSLFGNSNLQGGP